MKTQVAAQDDFEGWLELARQVEFLFGPMVGEESFRQGLRHAIDNGHALCIRQDDSGPGSPLCGGIVISHEENRIEWLAVTEEHRGRGFGRGLLQSAVDALDTSREMSVQTFAPGIPEGVAARRLYLSFGFRDHAATGPTPAGIPTIVMIRHGERLSSGP